MKRVLRSVFILFVTCASIHPSIAQWVQTSAPSGNVNRLMLDATSIYVGYSDNGFGGLIGAYRSTDDGTSWISMNNGLTQGQLYVADFAQIDSGLVIGTGHGVWFSTNLGQNWVERNIGLPPVSFRSADAMAVVGNNVYLVIGTSSTGFFSSNRGLSWVTRGSGQGAEAGPILVRNTAMYVTGFSQVRKSTDIGATWTSISGGLPATLYGGQVIAIGDTLYVVSNGEGVFRSTNDGGSWTAMNNGLTGTALSGMSIAGNSSVFLLGTMFDGVFLSTNGGANWQPASQGLTSTWVNCLAIRPPYAYAATSFGGGSGRVWRRLLTDLVTSVEEERGHIPARTSLDQNYPNPFNPSTKIVYRVRGRESVKLKVYDVLGREISTLVDEVKAPGSYELTLDASSLPSGVYLYRLTAGSFKETKKLIVLK